MKPGRNPKFLSGFTLIELMVTMAILTIILGMALQVTESARVSIKVSEAKSINDAIARRAFDQISRDISQMLVREDARIEFKSKAGDDQIAFLTNSRGLTDGADVGDRMVSLVSYELADDPAFGKKLLRGSRGHQFDDPASEALNLDPSKSFQPIPSDNLQAISNNIIRMEVEYLVEGVSTVTRELTPPLTSEKLKGIIVTIVTLDDRGRRAIRPERVQTLAGEFTDAVAAKNTLDRWSTIRDGLITQNSSAFSKDAVRTIRCYQRTFLIP